MKKYRVLIFYTEDGKDKHTGENCVANSPKEAIIDVLEDEPETTNITSIKVCSFIDQTTER